MVGVAKGFLNLQSEGKAFFTCGGGVRGHSWGMFLEALTFDPGLPAASACDFAEQVVARVHSAWEGGADLVLLPEFLWMGLEPHTVEDPGGSALERVAHCFEQTLLPKLRVAFSRTGKAVLAGTCPWLTPGGIRNRALLFSSDGIAHQDKLHLTPWEKAFSPGEALRLMHFGGLRVATLICLDVEIPELAARLRGERVDLILCPSATETLLGVERVDRCASARAVELGCCVAVSHLTGRAQSDLIDENIGRAAIYLPSQHVFRHAPRWVEGEVHHSGCHALRVELDATLLAKMRRMTAETNPSLLGKDLAGIGRSIPLESA